MEKGVKLTEGRERTKPVLGTKLLGRDFVLVAVSLCEKQLFLSSDQDLSVLCIVVGMSLLLPAAENRFDTSIWTSLQSGW